MLRNTFGILLGIIIGISIMIISVFFVKSFFIQIKYTPFIELQKIFNTAPFGFFIIILIFYIFSLLSSSLFTAFYVRIAKQAYLLLMILILSTIALIYACLYNFMLWIKISIFCIFFLSSWIGTKTVKMINKY